MPVRPLLFPATAKHTATVIFAHGLGDSGHGWADAVENWRRREKLNEVKFILPHAPSLAVTCNGGYRMPAWYDIFVIDGGAESLREKEDEPGITNSQQYFHQLVQKEIDSGIPADRIVLGGFSQGGAMSMFAGLTAPVKLAGIVAMSSYLLLSVKFKDIVARSDLNKATPVLMLHGDVDQVVNPELGKTSHDILKDLGYKVDWKTYKGMGHSACLEELDDVEAFLRARLPPLGGKSDAKSDAKSEL